MALPRARDLRLAEPEASDGVVSYAGGARTLPIPRAAGTEAQATLTRLARGSFLPTLIDAARKAKK
jgi:hypothetical protein